MVLTKLTTQGLDGLCSKEQLHLLNVVDSLRSQGISHYISLPQIIVCGDQSSGKSSVLEAISGVSFPVQSNLCTRFPTELILRKTAFISVNVSIVPHQSRSESEKASLSEFHERLDSFQDLPTLIENAKAAMGIMTLGKTFSKDLLRIEISGPERPHLTIVDLPGLIHSETKHQSASDIQLITDVVKSYMKEPRSIILAVVSAKNDFANQVVLKLARKADPKGTRTLGVITKPDTLAPGSGSENQYISLAKNQEVEFRLGWHILRNRDTDAEDWSLEDRDTKEAEFFSTGTWASLPSAQLGIKTLRTRLSDVLIHQIGSELPNLVDEIAKKSTSSKIQLDKLGQPRTNAHEQRIYLVQISQSFQTLVQAAVDGTYNDPFFGDAMSASGYQKRIRATIQNLNRDFATRLTNQGRYYKVVSSNSEAEESDGDSEDEGAVVLLTREDFIDKIMTMIDRSRGRELPGMFNSMIVSDLFKDQSSPWREIAELHVQKAWGSARLCMKHVIDHIADVTTVKAIWDTIMEPTLDSIRQALLNKVSDLIKPHQDGHPITYNHYFTENLQKIRLDRETERIEGVLEGVFGEWLSPRKQQINMLVDFSSLTRKLSKQPDQDMNHFAASEALDCLDAYYEVALKRFLDDIAVEVIEACLVAKLRGLFDPLSVSMMQDEDVGRIAGETEESRTIREDLEAKLKILRNGLETCKKFAGFQTLDFDDDKSGDDESSDNEEEALSEIEEAKSVGDAHESDSHPE